MVNVDKKIIDKYKNVISISRQWVESQCDGRIALIDPVDKKEIDEHYGTTHISFAYIVYGYLFNDKTLFKLGIKLIKDFLLIWNIASSKKNFHRDFNNFALCVIHDFLTEHNLEPNLRIEIENIIRNSKDSVHFTVNWLPMRLYVNTKRVLWFSDSRAHNKCAEIKSSINKAIFSDGFIDDRIPLGLSYNLQYNISSTALLFFLAKKNLINVDLGCLCHAVFSAICPDGDINYFGRGTNQLFAWGPFFYLSSFFDFDISSSVTYFDHHFLPEKYNILLNDYCGEDKFLWWDYHYCSVYYSHFLFWISLILTETKSGLEMNNQSVAKIAYSQQKSGISIISKPSCFAFVFNGRKEYPSERGPQLGCLWIKSKGTIFKGSLGPWLGHFGRKYSFLDLILHNFFGLISAKHCNDFSNIRVINRVFSQKQIKVELQLSPLFSYFDINCKNDSVELLFFLKKKQKCFLNLPIYESACFNINDITAFVDCRRTKLEHCLKIKNQYGWLNVLQSKIEEGKEWKVIFKI